MKEVVRPGATLKLRRLVRASWHWTTCRAVAIGEGQGGELSLKVSKQVIEAVDRSQNTEDRRKKTKDRRQKVEDKIQKT